MVSPSEVVLLWLPSVAALDHVAAELGAAAEPSLVREWAILDAAALFRYLQQATRPAPRERFD